MRNYGQHNALLCGIRLARCPIIVTLDDDLKTPPEEIPRILAKLAEGHDVVYGTPNRQTHGLFRNLASWTTKLALQSAMGAPTARSVSAFRVFRTHLRDAFSNASNMVTGFSTLPLQLASLIGFVFTFFGLALLAYVLGRWFIEGDSVPGFPFLASAIAIFSGAQLFALGIIGEYLARMHFRMMDRLSYAVLSNTDAPGPGGTLAGCEPGASTYGRQD